MIDHNRAVTIQRESLRAEITMIAGAAPDSVLYDNDGILAAVVPSAPDQPIVNMAACYDGRGLRAGLEALILAYRSAGVRRWEFWLPDYDIDSAARLAARGFHHAARLPAILLDLTTWEPPDHGTLVYDVHAGMPTLGRINDLAHDGGGGLTAALRLVPDTVDLRLYQAYDRATPAAVVAAIDNAKNSDCGVYFAATDPRAGGKRLGRNLLTNALIDARERGCVTASGQASEVGAPIWASIGFDTVFSYNLYTWTETDA